jgi:hypothetical protein
MHARLVFLVALSPLVAVARSQNQTVVSPAHFTNAEAPTSNAFPFGSVSQTFRYAQIHDDLAGAPRAIIGMAFRRNGTTTTDFAAFSVTLSAWCSTATTTGAAPAAAFDTNHWVDKAQVITGKVFNFPAAPSGFVPDTFAYDLPYDTPFLFAGAGPLCWEIQRTATTNTTNRFHDAVSGAGAVNPPLAAIRFGAGCKLSTQTSAMVANGDSAMNWPGGTGNLTIRGTLGPQNSLVVVFLGFSRTVFAGIPLPLLIPGTQNAPSGDCHLYTEIVVVTAALTSATGASSVTIPVPATPELNGGSTYAQILASDPAANPAGAVTSNGVQHNFVAPYGAVPGGRVYLSGSLGPTGTADGDYLLVTRFTY